MKELESKIVNYLQNHSSSEKRIYSAQLEEEFKTSGIQVRNAIKGLRRAGEPIANSDSGYFYATTRADIAPTVSDLKRRAVSMLTTASALERNFIELGEHQTEIPFK